MKFSFEFDAPKYHCFGIKEPPKPTSTELNHKITSDKWFLTFKERNSQWINCFQNYAQPEEIPKKSKENQKDQQKEVNSNENSKILKKDQPKVKPKSKKPKQQVKISKEQSKLGFKKPYSSFSINMQKPIQKTKNEISSQKSNISTKSFDVYRANKSKNESLHHNKNSSLVKNKFPMGQLPKKNPEITSKVDVHKQPEKREVRVVPLMENQQSAIKLVAIKVEPQVIKRQAISINQNNPINRTFSSSSFLKPTSSSINMMKKEKQKQIFDRNLSSLDHKLLNASKRPQNQPLKRIQTQPDLKKEIPLKKRPEPCIYPIRIQRQWELAHQKRWNQLSSEEMKKANQSMRKMVVSENWPVSKAQSNSNVIGQRNMKMSQSSFHPLATRVKDNGQQGNQQKVPNPFYNKNNMKTNFRF